VGIAVSMDDYRLDRLGRCPLGHMSYDDDNVRIRFILNTKIKSDTYSLYSIKSLALVPYQVAR